MFVDLPSLNKRDVRNETKDEVVGRKFKPPAQQRSLLDSTTRFQRVNHTLSCVNRAVLHGTNNRMFYLMGVNTMVGNPGE